MAWEVRVWREALELGQAWSRGQEQEGWVMARRTGAGWVGASWSCNPGGACPGPVSCRSHLEAEERGAGGETPESPPPWPRAPTSTSILDGTWPRPGQWGHVSLEAMVGVVSSRAVSNQDVVPGNAGAPIKEGCDGVL